VTMGREPWLLFLMLTMPANPLYVVRGPHWNFPPVPPADFGRCFFMTVTDTFTKEATALPTMVTVAPCGVFASRLCRGCALDEFGGGVCFVPLKVPGTPSSFSSPTIMGIYDRGQKPSPGVSTRLPGDRCTLASLCS